MKKYYQVILSTIALLFALSACSQFDTSSSLPDSNRSQQDSTVVEPFSDLRSLFGETVVLEEHEYKVSDLYTFWFNEGTVFQGHEEEKAAILESGRNPGLDVYKLHDDGITGAGVTVAIIDQPLFLNHPEYDGKIVAYHSVGSAGKGDPSSMHGPAVTSLLAGNTIGTAPGVEIYYVAMASWDGDAAQGAESLDWIIEQNDLLDEENKIRVVSASVDFSNRELFINHDAWIAAVQRAEDAGIMVLDAREGYDTCIIWPSSFNREAPEDITQSKIGGPSGLFKEQPAHTVAAPIGYRTTAEHYEEETPSYAYDAEGGHSWAIPYGAGIFALGWQVNPKLSVSEITSIAFETAYINDAGEVFLYPAAFIDAIQKTVDK